MLTLALWRRVSQYGLTPGRYLALGLAVWLLMLVAYYFISRGKSIKFIPASLCVLTLAVSFGPWGMLALSERSQIERLRSIAERNGILVDGRVREQHGDVSFADATEIRSILQYLHEIHGYDGIQPWFQEGLKAEAPGAGPVYKEYPAVAHLMGIPDGPTSQGPRERIFALKTRGEIDIRGYDRMLRLRQSVLPDSAKASPENLACWFERRTGHLFVASGGRDRDTLAVDLAEHLRKIIAQYGASSSDTIPQEKFALRAESAQLKVKVCFLSMDVSMNADTVKPLAVDADILYTLKE
jgi:hypothetical protein